MKIIKHGTLLLKEKIPSTKITKRELYLDCMH